MPQGEQPAIAVCGMVERDGAVLMVRNCGLPAAGEWAFPGGTVEWGELLEVALMRHVEEETGLVVESQGLLASLDIFDRTPDWTVEHHFVINVYRCRLLRGEAKKADDASNVAWIHRSDLASYTIWHPTLYALRHAGIDVAPAVSLDVRPATPADALVVRRVLDAAFAVHRRRLPYVPGALRETETDVEADVACAGPSFRPQSS